ncbi:MAG: hypothetical protein ABR572_07195 [Cryomorphaceae bacterium]|nr:hypothetical protein [Flavobacteriales bacterium]
MKKAILGAISLFCATLTFAQAQDNPALTNKRGVEILPQAGDWGLGFNAVPFLNYIGNSFNGAGSNSVGTDYINSSQMIFGKYFLTDNKAIRGSARLGFGSNTQSNFVRDMNTGVTPTFVEDYRTVNNSDIFLSGGLEWRRGKGRVQGYYGAELGVGFSNRQVNYDYGNEMTATNPSVFSTVWGGGFGPAGNGGSGGFFEDQVSDRVVQENSGSTISFGARAFVGVEFFFAPNMSIAGEFGWGPMFMIGGDGDELRERIVNGQLERRELPSGTRNGFNLDNDNLNGSLALFFYF